MKNTMFVGLLAAASIFGTGCMAESGTDESVGEETASEEQVTTQQDALFGSDACKDVNVKITNRVTDGGDGVKIKVHYFKYYSASEGKWLTEDVSNTEISYGSTKTFTENLENAENDLITKFRVYFKAVEADGDWSDLWYTEINTTDKTCIADATYTMTVSAAF